MASEHEAAQGAEQRWVSIAQAARALGITERAVRGRIDRGTMPCRRETVGNRTRHRVLLTMPRHDPHAEQHRHDLAVELVEARAEARAIMERMTALLTEKDLRIADLQRETERLGRLVEHAMELRREAERPRRWRFWRRGG